MLAITRTDFPHAKIAFGVASTVVGLSAAGVSVAFFTGVAVVSAIGTVAAVALAISGALFACIGIIRLATARRIIPLKPSTLPTEKSDQTEKLQKERDALVEELSAARKAQRDAETKLAESQVAKKTFEGVSTRSMEISDQLLKEINDLHSKQARLELEIQAKSTEVDKLQQTLVSLQQQLTGTATEQNLKVHSKELEEQRSRITQLESDIKRAKDSCASWKRQLEQSKLLVAAFEKLAEERKSEIETLTANVKALEAQKVKLESDLKTSDDEFEKRRKVLETALQNLTLADKAKRDAESKMEALQKQWDQLLEARMAKLNAELNTEYSGIIETLRVAAQNKQKQESDAFNLQLASAEKARKAAEEKLQIAEHQLAQRPHQNGAVERREQDTKQLTQVTETRTCSAVSPSASSPSSIGHLHPLSRMISDQIQKLQAELAIREKEQKGQAAQEPQQIDSDPFFNWAPARLQNEINLLQGIPSFEPGFKESEETTAKLANLNRALRAFEVPEVPEDYVEVSSVRPPSSPDPAKMLAVKNAILGLFGVRLPWQSLPSSWMQDYINGDRVGNKAAGELRSKHIFESLNKDLVRPGMNSRRFDGVPCVGEIAHEMLSKLLMKTQSAEKALEIMTLLYQNIGATQSGEIQKVFYSDQPWTPVQCPGISLRQGSPCILMEHLLDTTGPIQVLFAHKKALQLTTEEKPLAYVTAYTWVNYTTGEAYWNWRVDPEL